MSPQSTFFRRLVDGVRSFALRFFTPKEYRAVLLFLAIGLAVLCYRAGRRVISYYFPKAMDSTEIRTVRHNDSLFAALSRKDFVRDSLEFWMPPDSLDEPRGPKYASTRSKKELGLKRGCISINGSSADSLRLLPGIGKSMAARIVAYRTERGRFRRLQELMNIQGVGRKLFARIAPYLRLN